MNRATIGAISFTGSLIGLSGLGCQNFGIKRKIPTHACRQLERHFDRLVVLDRFQLELGIASSSAGLEYEIVIHKHTHHAIVHQARSPCLRLGAGAERIIDAITLRDNFPEDCGPWREHDFGSLKVFLHGMTMASLDPSDPSVTKRIITIMLAEEY